MSYDDAAYQKGLRERRRAAAQCIRCGEPQDRAGTRCNACVAVALEKVRYRRRLARIGDALKPRLQESVKTGQALWIAPSESRKLLELLHGTVTPRPTWRLNHDDGRNRRARRSGK